MSSKVERFLDQCIETLSTSFDASFPKAMNEQFGQLQVDDLDNAGTEKLRTVLDTLTQRVVTEESLTILSTIIGRYPAHSLTPAHPFYVRQCCHLRRYDLASPLLTQSFDSFSASHHLVYQDHLTYHFWGGMCSIALQDWANAFRLFSLVLAVGGSGTSLIQLEAYRKYILISLIQYGRSMHLPHTSSSSRTLDTLASDYVSFASQFEFLDDLWREKSEKHEQAIKSTGNGGLLKFVLASIPGHKIIKMQDIYTTLPLSVLAKKAGLSESEALDYIHDLVARGRISAQAEGANVNFTKSKLTPSEQLARLQQDVRMSEQLRQRMESLQKTLELDPTYHAKQSDNNQGSDFTFDAISP